MFFEHNSIEFFSHAGDNTPYLYGSDFDVFLKELEVMISSNIFWYRENQFMKNTEKCHPFLIPFNHKIINSNNSQIKSSKSEELLGVIIDSELRFEKHIMKLCRKANQKVHALSRIANFMTLKKRRLLIKV